MAQEHFLIASKVLLASSNTPQTKNFAMKPKNDRLIRKGCGNLVEKRLNYLYEMALDLPYDRLRRRKIKEMVELSQKHQITLGRIKRTFCKKCYLPLIPGDTATCEFKRKENGFGFSIVCRDCKEERFIVIRSK